MGEVVDLLELARSAITDPAHWCTGALARDSANRSVGTQSPFAVKFCAGGAPWRVGYELDFSHHAICESERLLEDAARKLFGHALSAVNDGYDSCVPSGHRAILRVYDAAVDAARREEIHANPGPRPE